MTHLRKIVTIVTVRSARVRLARLFLIVMDNPSERTNAEVACN